MHPSMLPYLGKAWGDYAVRRTGSQRASDVLPRRLTVLASLIRAIVPSSSGSSTRMSANPTSDVSLKVLK